MKLPTIEGVIRRRILVNYRVDPDAIQRLIPRRFSPKLHKGSAVAGICLIRLEQIRPRLVPRFMGLSSENGAHRVAVTWTNDDGETQEGVFISRRDSDSRLNQLAGGHLFPGEHHAASFDVHETDGNVRLTMKSHDGAVAVHVSGSVSDSLPGCSIFKSTEQASKFFEPGSLGYSVTRDPKRLDGIVLETLHWRVEPLQVDSVSSSFFDDRAIFPEGAAQFDHALLMRNIDHCWHSAADLYL